MMIALWKIAAGAACLAVLLVLTRAPRVGESARPACVTIGSVMVLGCGR